ncbi:DUF1330 domain-containing protein [Pacificispira sp.]|uniref:DUF1330 domain-containing protein n=1 Tax=Pacificispira sp. TaxID=2888761 RepID=UPI003B52A5B8
MSAFIVAKITIKDPDRYKEYAEKFWPTLQAFGGTMLIRGTFVEPLNRDSDHDLAAVMHFPDKEAMLGWYRSADYQALIGMRNEVADMVVSAYEAFD